MAQAKKKQKKLEADRTVEILKKISATKEGSEFGLQMMDVTKIADVPRTPSGILSLDLALGGGYPCGRIIEMFGPEGGGKTTVALHAMAEAQKRGGTTALVDVEHAYDPSYGTRVGIDHAKMLFSQPNSGEQALSTVDMLCDHLKKGDVIVVDSVANLTPQAERDGEMGDTHVGLLARLMSQAMRKLTSKVSESGVTLIFINQIRHKIGVMYGCFHEDTPVIFVDGSQHSIREVVEQKLEGPLLSFNEEAGLFEPRKIINWFQNGALDTNAGEQWLTISTSSAGGPNGNMSFTCTPGHTVYKCECSKSASSSLELKKVPASELKLGDKLVSWCEVRLGLNSFYQDILYGTMLGDGCLRLRSVSTACLSLANQEQPDYLKWKLTKLEGLNFTLAGNATRPRWDSSYTTELANLRRVFYSEDGSGFRGVPSMKELSPLSAAVWYMDDGCYSKSHRRGFISAKRFWPSRLDEVESLQKLLCSLIGCDTEGVVIDHTGKGLRINVAAFAQFSKKIAVYVPACMQYKLNPVDRNRYVDFDTGDLEKVQRIPYLVDVRQIAVGSTRKHRAKRKYDLQVEGNRNYLVGGSHRGVVVHNSPETTPGGNALKFYASQRLDIRRIAKLKETDERNNPLGHMVRIKIVKNKVAPPFREAELEIYYGYGFLRAADLCLLGVAEGIITRSGTWYSLDGVNLGQGAEKTKHYLASNPDKMDMIEEKVRAIYARNST